VRKWKWQEEFEPSMAKQWKEEKVQDNAPNINTNFGNTMTDYLVANAFADGLEVIAHQLARNAGMDERVVEEAKMRHHEGRIWAGIDPFGKAKDMIKNQEKQNQSCPSPSLSSSFVEATKTKLWN